MFFLPHTIRSLLVIIPPKSHFLKHFRGLGVKDALGIHMNLRLEVVLAAAELWSLWCPTGFSSATKGTNSSNPLL